MQIVASPERPSVTGRLAAFLDECGRFLHPVPSSLQEGVDYPAEFEPFGAMPLDDLLVGVVRHAGQAGGDLPLATFDPDRFVGVYLGSDTRRSLGVLLGLLIADADGDAEVLQDVAVGQGFDPDLLPTEPPLGVLPRVPPGWRLARTADGLGVLAPVADFSAGQSFEDAEFGPVEPGDAAAAARRQLARGHAASGLCGLRDAAAFLEPHERRLLAAPADECRGTLAGRDNRAAR